MSFKAASASFSLREITFCGTFAISALAVAMPFWVRAARTASNC